MPMDDAKAKEAGAARGELACKVVVVEEVFVDQLAKLGMPAPGRGTSKGEHRFHSRVGEALEKASAPTIPVAPKSTTFIALPFCGRPMIFRAPGV